MSFSWATCGSWLLQSAVAGGVLLLLTQLLARFVRQPARRQRLCEYGVMAALLAAVLSLLLPGWLLVPHPAGGTLARGVSAPIGLTLDPVPAPKTVQTRAPGATGGLPSGATAPDGSTGGQAASGTPTLPVEGVDESAPSLGETAVEWSRAWLLPGLALVQALGAVLFFGYLLVGHVALLRLLAKARPAPPDVIELFLPLIAGGRPPRLLVSEKVRVPLSCGLLRPTVVLPANLCEPANARKLRWIFAHELTHLRRWDAWSCLLFCLGQALYFYVPWFWWLRRQARLCQEFVADAVAALEEVPPVSYAEFLVSLTRAPAVPMAATGVAGQSSDLFRRVSMLLQNSQSVERDCPRRWSLLAAGSLLGLAVVLSGVSLTAQPAQAQEKEVIIRRAQGEPVKITIYIEGGDKKEPVIRKDEKVKVFVVPDGDKGKKQERILYWTPRVIIEKKGDAKATRDGDVRYWIEQFKGPEKEAPQAPVRKGKAVGEKEGQDEKPAPKKDVRYRTLTVPQDLHLWTEKFDPKVRLWDAKDGRALIQWHQKADVNLDKLRKALEKLEKIPNVDAEQIRREVMKALEQLHKVQPKDGKFHIEYRFVPEKEKGTVEKKQIERKQSEKQSERKSAEPSFSWVLPNADEKVRLRAVEALGQLQNRVGHQGRLGVEIDLPGEILADQLNLPKGHGLVVRKVLAKSPADVGGLKVGDVLLHIDRHPVPADRERFVGIVKELPGGQALEVVIIRKGKRQTLRVGPAPERTADDVKLQTLGAVKADQAAIAKGLAHLQNLQKSEKELTATATSRALASFIGAHKQPAAKDGVLTTTFRKGDHFTTRHQEGSLIITVVGSANDPKSLEITVQDGAVSNRYDRLNRVPAAYRDKVSHLIDISGKGASQLAPR